MACGIMASRRLKSKGDLYGFFTRLFNGVNMALLMPFMPLHLHIREFQYFISRVAYEKVECETERHRDSDVLYGLSRGK